MGMAFLDRLWRDWSPGYDAAEDLARVKESLRQPANLQAAISYYRDTASATASGDAVPYAAEEHAAALRGSQPTLYLHGGADHFLHLEQPAEVNRHILA
jgi:hypothetical protein